MSIQHTSPVAATVLLSAITICKSQEEGPMPSFAYHRGSSLMPSSVPVCGAPPMPTSCSSHHLSPPVLCKFLPTLCRYNLSVPHWAQVTKLSLSAQVLLWPKVWDPGRTYLTHKNTQARSQDVNAHGATLGQCGQLYEIHFRKLLKRSRGLTHSSPWC